MGVGCGCAAAQVDGRPGGDPQGLRTPRRRPVSPGASRPSHFPWAPWAQDTRTFVSAFCFLVMQIRWKHNSASKRHREAATSQHLRDFLGPLHLPLRRPLAPRPGLPAHGSRVTTRYPRGPPRPPPTLMPRAASRRAVVPHVCFPRLTPHCLAHSPPRGACPNRLWNSIIHLPLAWSP